MGLERTFPHDKSTRNLIQRLLLLYPLIASSPVLMATLVLQTMNKFNGFKLAVLVEQIRVYNSCGARLVKVQDRLWVKS